MRGERGGEGRGGGITESDDHGTGTGKARSKLLVCLLISFRFLLLFFRSVFGAEWVVDEGEVVPTCLPLQTENTPDPRTRAGGDNVACLWFAFCDRTDTIHVCVFYLRRAPVCRVDTT